MSNEPLFDARAAMDILESYRKWLFKVALALTDHRHAEELAQEGWIAMWKALKTFDPEQWALPAWLTYHAKDRMRQVALRNANLTGQPAKKGHIRVPWEPISDEEIDSRLAAADAASADYLELLYHQGEIRQALNELAPPDRVFMEERIMLDKSYHGWRVEARKIKPAVRYHLQDRLEHLREYC